MYLVPVIKQVDLPSLIGALGDKLRSCFTAKSIMGGDRGHLQGLADDLEAAVREAEPGFVQIGQELHTLYGDAKELTRQVLDSVDLIGGREKEGVLFQLREFAERALAELEHCRKDVTEKTVLINSVMEHLSALSEMCRTIERVGVLLKVVAMNIGIESARSSESAEIFSVVSHDTGKLSEKIRSISGMALGVLEAARNTQRSLYGDISEGMKEINRLGENAHGIVKEAVGEIENLVASALQFVEQAGEHSGRISRQVGDLVVAVQFHDSMSQRLEHITKALCDVDLLLAESASDKRGADHGQKFSQAYSLLNLQSSQLKDVIAGIERVNEKGRGSFEEILKEIGELVDQLSDLSTSKSIEQCENRQGPAGDPFNRLKSSFSDLEAVLHQGKGLMAPIRDAAFRVSATVDRISECIKDIQSVGFETHLMALNAIVKAANLGREGSAIEVLAHEVKQSSDKSISVLAQTDELLRLLNGAAEKLRVHSEDSNGPGSLNNSIEEITLTYDQFTEGSFVAREKAEEIEEAVSISKASLDFLPVLSKRLAKCLARLETTARDFASFSTEENKLSQEEVDKILGRYTMEKEREVHKVSFSGFSCQAAQRGSSKALHERFDASGKTEQGKAAEERLEDNVVLFSDSEPGPADEAGCCDVMCSQLLTQKNGEHAADESESEGENQCQEDFGNNVELF